MISDQVRVLSVDLFDTLVLRSVARPADVFARLADRAAGAGLLHAHVTSAQFDALRRTCEQRARGQKQSAAGTTEVTLAEIYAAWPAGVLRNASAVAQLEIQVEAEGAFPHPATLALVREARSRGLRTALVSDTYFGRDALAAILAGAGITPDLFDLILASSDEGCSKHDGRLFQRLLEHWPDVPPAAVLHIGDHPHADVTQARRAGVIGMLHDTGHAGTVGNALRLETLCYGDVLPELASLRRLASTGSAPVGESRWFYGLGASVLGPLFSVFADWVVESCVRDDIRTVRPIMREGALFARLIARSSAAAGAGLDVSPLYASRSATWLAGLDEFDRGAAQRMLQRQHLTVNEVLHSLDLRGHGGASALAAFGDVALGDAPGTPTPDGISVADLLRDVLGRDDVRAHVATAIARARRSLRAYIDHACGKASRVALVDLGFHASVGQAIERATRAASPRSFHNFLVFAADRVAELWADGYDVRAWAAGPGDSADLAGAIARHPAVLETLLIDAGTTLGYLTDGDSVAPLCAPSGAAEWQQTAAAACRAGIEAFQDCWLTWRRAKPELARGVVANRRALTATIHRLISMPTAEEAFRLGPFVHEDNEGGHSLRPLADASAPADFVTPEEFLRATLSGGPAFGRSWLWPAGVCEQRWPGHLEQRRRAVVGTGDSAPPALPALAMRMRQAGVRACVVWGAGEAGTALIKAIRHEGLDVLLVTDSNPAVWGSTIDGVRVVSPLEARERGNDIFAIGSCAFASDIERTIRQQYAAPDMTARIFSPFTEVAA